MEFRDLQEGDRESLFLIVKDVYNDTPLSMWFKKEPTEEEFSEIFSKKLGNLRDNVYIDIVAIENERIIGECEILKIDENTGIIGIIVKKEFRNQGTGTELLNESFEKARALGIRFLNAEIMINNQVAKKFLLQKGFQAREIEKREIRGVESDVMLLQKIMS